MFDRPILSESILVAPGAHLVVGAELGEVHIVHEGKALVAQAASRARAADAQADKEAGQEDDDFVESQMCGSSRVHG